MTHTFEVQGLTVQFGGVKAVNDVSFSVGAGRFVGLIGPNGAGKTTFMDAVTGMVPSRGRVLLDGRDLNRLPAHRRIRAGIGRTFQSLELFEDLTVHENLTVAATTPTFWSPLVDLLRPRPSQSGTEAVDRAIELMGLGDVSEALPTSLSLGQRKLVTIARSLAAEPRILLLDEPAAGLDTQEGIDLGRVLRGLLDSGITIIMIDHDMSLVLSVSDQVVVLDFGQVIANGTPQDVRADERVISAYLGVDEETVADAGQTALLAGSEVAR